MISQPFLEQFERLEGPSYLDGQLAGGFSAHLKIGNGCSQSARGHDGDKEGGELHRGEDCRYRSDNSVVNIRSALMGR